MSNELDSLVNNGDIVSYQLVDVDEGGNVGKSSPFRNTQRLILNFASGSQLVMDTFCSGSNENTELILSYNQFATSETKPA